MISNKGNIKALLPIFLFLFLFIGFGAFTGDFYKMPAVIAFGIALIFAFMQKTQDGTKLSFAEKIAVLSKSAGNENIITMCLVFLLAGAFSGAVSAAGGVENTVNFGLSILPASLATAGVFVIACFISISMGTSVGTIAALTPIAVGISQATSINIAICVGAVICGAMFGDNLSMISDTTIAAARTQGCSMKDKFRENFKIVLPAAIITFIIFLVITSGTSYVSGEQLTYNLVKIIPYAVVLVGALVGVNVFTILTSGTVISLIIGLAYGDFVFTDVFSIIGDGVAGMFEITVLSIIAASVFGLVKNNGGIDYILHLIRSKVKTKKGAELGIGALAALTDLSTANNTVAIVIAGPIAKEISQEFDISPKRTASILDIFTSAFQGIIPYGAQVLTAAKIAEISPLETMPYLYYPILMMVSAILFILLVKKDKKKV